MNITSSFLPIPPGSSESGKTQQPLAPVQPVARARDLVLERRAVVPRPEVDNDERREAEALIGRYADDTLAGLNSRRSRRALRVYDGVARGAEQDYVSRVLGIDEIA